MLSVDEIAVLVKRRRSMPLRRRLLYMAYLSTAVERPLIPDIKFNLHLFANSDAILKFRFDIAGILKLGKLLNMPGVVITKAQDRCLAVEALCIVLYRLSYPMRYFDMIVLFGRSRESMCRISMK